ENSGRHWWLTAFRVGAYCEPRDLEVQVGINFPNTEMLQAFVRALREYGDVEYAVCGQQVRILFHRGISYQYPFWRRMLCRYVQWKNKILCKLVVRMTKPFTCGMDRVLDLYFCLPRLIRRIFCQRKRERCCKKSCRSCYRSGRLCGENRGGCVERDRRCGRSCRKR
ncbi:MAG: DUF4474 domain-containing protein, partial [Lachnospiraceae bacterium]|nr:DUF4474 domain-containing protein [Lachnospiraceae bacterium]